jgi:HD-GYP domain-containing protein (c-di-GMP phosphodiesterase class II)
MKTPTIRLRGLGGAFAGRTWELSQVARIGRAPNVETHLPDDSVSRRHAELTHTGNGWVIRDLGSSNGTFHNGACIGQAEGKLRNGDVLQFGDVILMVEAISEIASSAGPAAEEYVASKEAFCRWDDVPQLLNELLASSDGKAITALMKIGRSFPDTLSLKDFFKTLLWDIAESLEADASALLIMGQEQHQLELREVIDPTKALQSQILEQHPLITRSARKGKSLLGQNVQQTQSIVCAVVRAGPGKNAGIVFLMRNLKERPFTEHDLVRADLLALSASPSLQSFQRVLLKQQSNLSNLLGALTQISRWHAAFSGQHAQRVSDIALLLAKELQLPEQARRNLQLGATLHDLGMLAISETILNKPGVLSDKEMAQVKTHAHKGAEILETIPLLSAIVPIVRNHHERWDGKGYPDGLSETSIPMPARIMAVADVLAALTEDRPHRPSLSLDDALAEIQRNQGTQFDPDCVAALLRVRPKLETLFEQDKALNFTVPVAEFKSLRESGWHALPGKEDAREAGMLGPGDTVERKIEFPSPTQTQESP